MDDFKENVIEFVLNDKTATVTFTQGRYISKIKKLAEKYPDDVKITHVNKDSSIVAHVPVRWIRISPPKELSDDVKERLIERGKENLNKLRATQSVNETE